MNRQQNSTAAPDSAMNIKRRTLVAALSFFGASAAFPVTVQAASSPETRLATAIQDAKQAMFEMYGVWPQDQSQFIKNRGVVAIGVLPLETDELRWFVDDKSPLTTSSEVAQ